MMIPMIRSPPQNSFLHRGLRHESKYELPESIQLIAAMREVSVIRCRNKEHTNQIVDCKECHILPLKREKQDSKTHQMQNDERYYKTKLILL